MTSSYSDCPVTQWNTDQSIQDDDDLTDGPTLTMTLPPLLLHANSVTQRGQEIGLQNVVRGQVVSSPSPVKMTSPCPLCAINHNKVSVSFIYRILIMTFPFSFTVLSVSLEEILSIPLQPCVKDSVRSSYDSFPWREKSQTARRKYPQWRPESGERVN